jgi:hypothetical protein
MRRILLVLSTIAFFYPKVGFSLCLPTPCYNLKVAVESYEQKSPGMFVVKGTLLDTEEISCLTNSTPEAKSDFLKDVNTPKKLPKYLSLPAKNADKFLDYIKTEEIPVLFIGFMDCCDTPKSGCVNGYQIKLPNTNTLFKIN